MALLIWNRLQIVAKQVVENYIIQLSFQAFVRQNYAALQTKSLFSLVFFWIICQRNQLSLCLGFRADKKYDWAIDQKKSWPCNRGWLPTFQKHISIMKYRSLMAEEPNFFILKLGPLEFLEVSDCRIVRLYNVFGEISASF